MFFCNFLIDLPSLWDHLEIVLLKLFQGRVEENLNDLDGKNKLVDCESVSKPILFKPKIKYVKTV